MSSVIQFVNSVVWSPALVVICLLCGLYFSFRTRFVQVRRFGMMFRLLFKGDDVKKEKGISSFQAFAMALSGRVGTGNIVGVATAIGFGGPGAIVWMWIIAFFGAGSAFIEATLAQIYKENHHGQFRGGPAYYIEKGLRSPFFAMFFAVIAAVICGFFLPPIHSNSIAVSFSGTFGIPTFVAGLVVAFLMALVVIGGVKRIANVAQVVAPMMALIYIILSVVVLVVNHRVVPDVFLSMLRGAVGINQVGGALLGASIAWGVKRGIYSNEAGQGTGAIVAGSAEVSHPVKQGLVQAFSVYIDTLLVCTATAMMILACRTYNIVDTVTPGPDGPVVSYLLQNPEAPLGEPGFFYTSKAIGSVVGYRFGDMVIAIALFFFAFTTLMAYYFYAETNLIYIFSRVRQRKLRKMQKMLQAERIVSQGDDGGVSAAYLGKRRDAYIEEEERVELADVHFGDDRWEKVVVWILRVVTIAAIITGSIVSAGMVWMIGDIGVGLMAWINIIAIVLLSPKALRALKQFDRQLGEGREPVFDTDSLDIQNADYWERSEREP